MTIAKLRNELAAYYRAEHRDVWEQDFNCAIANCRAESARLAGAQARIKELREALEKIGTWVTAVHTGRDSFVVAKQALSTPDDSSALDAALKAEYDRGYEDGKNRNDYEPRRSLK